MFLFLAGHSHSVAFYFFRKKAPEQSHSRKLSQVVVLCSIFTFSLVSQKKKKAPNRLLGLGSVRESFLGNMSD